MSGNRKPQGNGPTPAILKQKIAKFLSKARDSLSPAQYADLVNILTNHALGSTIPHSLEGSKSLEVLLTNLEEILQSNGQLVQLINEVLPESRQIKKVNSTLIP
jgi:hypothetical protein